MVDFFPRQTIEWRVRELSSLRRLAVSLVGMAVITGVVVHLYRWLVLSYRPANLWLFFALAAVFVILLLGMATAHLGNHTVPQWLWRAPLFAVVEGMTEAAVGALLIAAGMERIGSQLAQWHDWPSMALHIVLRRTVAIVVFAMVLAVVVQWVRYILLKREHRESTAIAVAKEHE
jgi:uncharacterized membrane protein